MVKNLFEQEIQEIKAQLELIELSEITLEQAFEKIKQSFRENIECKAPLMLILRNFSELSELYLTIKENVDNYKSKI